MKFNYVFFLKPLVLFTIQDTPILNSNKIISGKAITTILTGSGGVIKDDTIKIATIECLL